MPTPSLNLRWWDDRNHGTVGICLDRYFHLAERNSEIISSKMLWYLEKTSSSAFLHAPLHLYKRGCPSGEFVIREAQEYKCRTAPLQVQSICQSIQQFYIQEVKKKEQKDASKSSPNFQCFKVLMEHVSWFIQPSIHWSIISLLFGQPAATASCK